MRIIALVLLLMPGLPGNAFGFGSSAAAPDSLVWKGVERYAGLPDQRLFSVYSNDQCGPGNLFITFNLESLQSVELELVDMLGRRIGNQQWSGVLDQTFRIELPDLYDKILIVRLLIDNSYYTNKIYLNK